MPHSMPAATGQQMAYLCCRLRDMLNVEVRIAYLGTHVEVDICHGMHIALVPLLLLLTWQ